MVDSTLVSDMMAYHHWNGKVDPEWQRKAVNHIFSMQLPDGGWNIYYGGPSEVNATIKAYLALKLAGVPVTDPRMLRAREVALNLGGVPRMNTFSKLYLALLGLFPWEYVPTIPCEVMLIGKWFHVNFWEMSNWSPRHARAAGHHQPFQTHPPARRTTSTSTNFIPQGIPRTRPGAARPTRTGFPGATSSSGSTGCTSSPSGSPRTTSIRSANARSSKAEQWMLERFEGSDGLAAIFPAMLNSLIALKALGYPGRPSAGRCAPSAS